MANINTSTQSFQTSLESFLTASPYTAAVDYKKLRFIYRMLEYSSNKSRRSLSELEVLEVACGRGGITLPLVSLGCQVRAFDLVPEPVALLRADLQSRNWCNATLGVDNGYTFDFATSFDVVIASEVFEHVLEPEKLAANIRRHMRPGSVLVVTTPNGYGPWEMKNRLNPLVYVARMDCVRRWLGKPPFVRGSGPDHCQFYTRSRLCSYFEALSMRLISSSNSDFLSSLARSLRSRGAIAQLDIKLADCVPAWAASGWYFAFELS
jgi:SAM-dependent methyltransferase